MRNMYFFHLLGLMVFSMSLFYSLTSLTWLGCWLGMELGNLMLYLWFNINFMNRNVVLSSLYYWVSGISGFGMLGCYFFYEIYPFITMVMFLIFFIFKMGLFPFYGWVLMLFKHSDYVIFFILSSLMKLPLLMMVDYFFYMKQSYMFLIMIFVCYISLLIGTSGMSQMSMKGIMGFSSINVSSDFFVSYFLSYDLFLFVFLNYLFLLFGLFFIFNSYFGNINIINFFNMKFLMNNNKFFEIIFLSLFGMPFFLSFYIKFFIGLYFYFQSLSVLNMLFFFIFMMIACLNYYRFWMYLNYMLNLNYLIEKDNMMNSQLMEEKGIYYFFLSSVILLGLYLLLTFFLFL